MAGNVKQSSVLPRLTVWRYLGADIRAVFLLCGFLAISVLLPLAAFWQEGLGSEGSEVSVDLALLAMPPLILFSAIVFDVWLMARRINRSISEGRLLRASVVKAIRAPGSIQMTVVMSVRDESEPFIRSALLFQQSRARGLSEGSVVTLAACSLARLRNPVPLEALFEESELAALASGCQRGQRPRSEGQAPPVEKGRKIRICVLILAIVSVLAIAALLIPVTEIFFRRLEGAGGMLARAIYAVFVVVIAVSHSLKALPRDPIVVSPFGIRAFSGDGCRFFKWEEMHEVSVRKFVGLRYFAMYSQGRELYAWIPFFLQDFGGFLSDVIREAPADNPLRCEVEKVRS